MLETIKHKLEKLLDPGISVNNNFSNIYVYHNLENGYIDEGQNFLSLCNIIMK